MARSALRTVTNSLDAGMVGGTLASLTSESALIVYNNGASNLTNVFSTATGGVAGIPGTRALQNIDAENEPAAAIWRRPDGRRFLFQIDRKTRSDGNFDLDVYLNDVGSPNGDPIALNGSAVQTPFRNTAFFANALSNESPSNVIASPQIGAVDNIFQGSNLYNDEESLEATATGVTLTQQVNSIMEQRLGTGIYCSFRVKGSGSSGEGIATISNQSSLSVFETGGHQRLVFPIPFVAAGATFTFDNQRGIRCNANYTVQAVWNVGHCLTNNPDGFSNAQSEGDGRICFGLNPIPGGTLPTREQLQAPGTIWRLRLEGNTTQYNGNSIIGTVTPPNDGANPENPVHRNYRIGTTAATQAAFGNTRLFEGGGRFVLERVQQTTNVTSNLAVEVALDNLAPAAVTIRVRQTGTTAWIDIPRNLSYTAGNTRGWAAIVGNGITQAQFDSLESASQWDIEVRQDLSQLANAGFFLNTNFHFQRSLYSDELYVAKLTRGAIRMWRKSNGVITEVTSNANIVNTVQPGTTLGPNWFRSAGGTNFGAVQDISFVAPTQSLSSTAENALLAALLGTNSGISPRLTRKTFLTGIEFANKKTLENWRKANMTRAPANHPEASLDTNIWRYNPPTNADIQLLPDNNFMWVLDRRGRAPPIAVMYDGIAEDVAGVTPPFRNMALTRFDDQTSAYAYLTRLGIDTSNSNAAERDRYIVQVLASENAAITSYMLPIPTGTALPDIPTAERTQQYQKYISKRTVSNIETEAAVPQGWYVSRFNDRAGYPGLMADIYGRYCFTAAHGAPLNLTTSTSTDKFNFSDRSKIQGQGENVETQPEESDVFPTHGWTRTQKTKVIAINDQNIPTFYTQNGPNIISGSFSATNIDQANIRSQNEVQFAEARPPSPIDLDNITIVIDANGQLWLQRFAADSVQQNVQYENLGTNRQPMIDGELLTKRFNVTSLTSWYYSKYTTKLAIALTEEGVAIVINFHKHNEQESWSCLDLRYLSNQEELGKIRRIFEVEGRVFMILTDKRNGIDSHRLHYLDEGLSRLGENSTAVNQPITRRIVPNIPEESNASKIQRKHLQRMHLSVAGADVSKVKYIVTDPVDGRKSNELAFPYPAQMTASQQQNYTGVLDNYLCTTLDGKFPTKTDNPIEIVTQGNIVLRTIIFEVKYTRERGV